jgi:hypothetical protein
VLGNQIDGRQGWMRVYGAGFTAHPFRQSAIPYVLSTIVVNRRAVVSSFLWGAKLPLSHPLAAPPLQVIPQIVSREGRDPAVTRGRGPPKSRGETP